MNKEKLKNYMRNLLYNSKYAFMVHSKIKEQKLLKEYRDRREYYHSNISKLGIKYDEKGIAQSVRDKLSKRGYIPKTKNIGEIHTFACIPRIGWHWNLFDDLYELGLVSDFDYIKHGFDWVEFKKADRKGLLKRQEMNKLLLEEINNAHKKNPIDWVFCYMSGTEISSSTILKIQETIGVPVVNMCLDDKQSWVGKSMGDHRGLQIDIAPIFDLNWTSSRLACDWYLAEGGLPIYMPEGFNANVYKPQSVEQDIDVSFIGNAYGFRKRVINYLEQNGIAVTTFGQGWNTKSVWGEEAVEILCRSKINLGMGGIGYSEWLTNVKTRDFEIPGTGGGVYITSFNPDLAKHFVIGKEIICYRTNDELLELIRYYLNNFSEAQEIANSCRVRCIKEHKWFHRYKRICNILGILVY